MVYSPYLYIPNKNNRYYIMKQLIIKLLRQAIQQEQKLYAVYNIAPTGKRIPLADLEFIKTPNLPRVGETINLIRKDRIYFYKVEEVNHIYHWSGFELEEGSIIVKYLGDHEID